MLKVGLSGVNSSYNLQTKNIETAKTKFLIEKKDNSKKLKTTLTYLATAGMVFTAGVAAYKFRGQVFKFRKLFQTPLKVDSKTMQRASSQKPVLPAQKNGQKNNAIQNASLDAVKFSAAKINSPSEKAVSQSKIQYDVQTSQNKCEIKSQLQSGTKTQKTSEQPEQEIFKKPQPEILQPKNLEAKEKDPAKILNSYSEDDEEAFVKALSKLDDTTLQQVNKVCPYNDFSQRYYIRNELEKRECLKLYGVDITKAVQPPRQDYIEEHHDLCGMNAYVRDRIKELKQNSSRINKHIDNYIEEVDEAFCNLSPLEADHTFYRGRIRNRVVEKFNEDLDLIDSSKAGDIITLDEGYPYFANNVCLARKFAKSAIDTQDNYMYEVFAPKGSKLSCNMEHGGEAVFPRASKFEIISKEIKEDGSTFVKLRYILP